MNKRFHRAVFDAARGLRMVVQKTARSAGKGSPCRLPVSVACLLAVAPLHAMAQGSPSAPNPFIEELRQRERERALREQQQKAVDAHLPRGGASEARRQPAAGSRNALFAD